VIGCTCDGGAGNGAAPADDCYSDGLAAFNYEPAATIACNNGADNDCCIQVITGCTDPNADLGSYDSSLFANTDDGSCLYLGCTNPVASNYDPNATNDDGSCIGIVLGCTDNGAMNYDASANVDDGSCIYTIEGCMDSGYWQGIPAFNYIQPNNDPDTDVNTEDGSCTYAGCFNNPNATNYLVPGTDCVLAGDDQYPPLTSNTLLPPCPTFDDGSCTAAIGGCTDPTACNYDNTNGLIDDGSCYSIACTDPGIAVNNYNHYDGPESQAMGGSYGSSVYMGTGVTDLYNLGINPSVGPGNTCGCEICQAPENISVNLVTETPAGSGIYEIVIQYNAPQAPWDASMYSTFVSSHNINNTGWVVNQNQSAWSTIVAGGTYWSTFTGINLGVSGPYPPIDFQVQIQCNGFTQNHPTLAVSPWNLLANWTLPWTQISGCTDPSACNYDPAATVDDGSCNTVYGCTDPLYTQYNPNATCDDGTCQTLIVSGCTDPTAFNYDPAATNDDGSCIAVVLGCTDDTYLNYDPAANTDDGSCSNCAWSTGASVFQNSDMCPGNGIIIWDFDYGVNGCPIGTMQDPTVRLYGNDYDAAANTGTLITSDPWFPQNGSTGTFGGLAP